MAFDESRSCPEPETLAAFADGSLEPATRAVVSRHVADCNSCLWVIREATRYAREPVPAESPRLRYLPVAAGFILAIVSAVIAVRYRTDPVRRMAAAVHESGVRTFEGRLARFDFARYTSTRSLGGAETAVATAAKGVIEETTDPQSATEWHRRGVAALLADRIELAVHDLETAVRLAPRSAVFRSDLAAARLALGSVHADERELHLALADADDALRLGPGSEDALFNRAVVLERLGERDAARSAYRAYLEVDSASPWAEEVRWRMNRL